MLKGMIQKRGLTKVHRWLSLLVAPVLLLILLSGAVLALKPIVQPEAVAVAPQAVVSTLRAIDPQGSANRLTVAVDGRSLEVRAPAAGVSGRFDLDSHAPLSAAPSFDPFAFALDLHKNLLVGAGFVVEVATYALVAILLIGLLLGWPRLRNTLLGWHGGLGWLALPLLALPPVTGLLMVLHIGGPALPPPNPAVPAPSLARAIEIAATQGELSAVNKVRVLRGQVVLLQGQSTQGPVQYLIRGDNPPELLPAGRNWVKELHEGTWGGAGSGALALLAALGLLTLSGTGLYSWLRRVRLAGQRSGDRNASILVAFASQTGTAARLAEATAQALRSAGEAVICASLAALDPRELAGFRHNLLIVSTTGDGDVPDTARPFLARLGDADLSGMGFSLLALGDSHYPTFCGGGRQVREALLKYGARETGAWQRADGEPGAVWRQWLEENARTLGQRLGAVETPDIDQPLTVTLVERERLDDPTRGNTRETWRLAFEVVGAHPEFRPGDLLLFSPAESEAARCYSIGSSACGAEPRIELTVGLHSWEDAAGNHRFGLASGYLCRLLQPGTSIAAKLRHHPGFNPPDDLSRPLLLVATGAGVAPFPGFIAERVGRSDAGPVWMLFGNRYRNGDFFYRACFEEWQRAGVLTRLDTAFSRDAGDGCHIQARIVENGAELLHWLVERQGVLYTCGRASTIGNAVEEALLTVIRQHGARYGLLQAEATLADWRARGTLRVDVFG